MVAAYSVGNLSRTIVDHIPVAWVEPVPKPDPPPLALWLPGLTGTKEDCVPFLRKLASLGFLGFSIDPWQHGERGSETGEQIARRVFGAFRRYLWPIVGQTTLDCLRVIDWVVTEFGEPPCLVAGGVSMGGDIAVALAGIDQRVTRVAAIVATADWTRPGMTDLNDQTRLLPQGQADAYAQWFYDALNPITHLDAYAHGPAITFECGELDSHVPPDGALRFQAAMRRDHPEAGKQIRVALHPGMGHDLDHQREMVEQRCLDWFKINSVSDR